LSAAKPAGVWKTVVRPLLLVFLLLVSYYSFALVAVIHGDAALELKSPTSGNFVTGGVESLVKGVSTADKASQLVRVGAKGTISADRDGYLYFFANDSAFAYSNNEGFVEVMIARA
jgi:hypothetical protein